MMMRPHLTRLISTRLISTRVPIIRTFGFTPRTSVFTTRDIWALDQERNRLLALKKRLKARKDHMDEMDDDLYDPMRLCLSEEH